MNLSHKNKKGRLKYIIIIMTTLFIAVYGLWMFRENMAKNQQNTAPITNSKERVINSPKDTPNSNLPQDKTTTSDQVPQSEDLSITIESLTQSNGVVAARAVTSDNGLCVFTFSTDNDKPVVRETNTINKSCSVTISQNEFSYLGEWQLTTTLYKDGEKAEAKQNVTIQ